MCLAVVCCIGQLSAFTFINAHSESSQPSLTSFSEPQSGTLIYTEIVDRNTSETNLIFTLEAVETGEEEEEDDESKFKAQSSFASSFITLPYLPSLLDLIRYEAGEHSDIFSIEYSAEPINVLHEVFLI